MEALNMLKFWRNAGPNTAAVRDIISDFESVKKFADAVDYVTHPVMETDEEIDNGEDSFFDLILTGPKQGKSEIKLPESPKDVFITPKAFPIESNLELHSPKLRVCFLSFRKSKPEKSASVNCSTAHQKQKLSANPQSKNTVKKCTVLKRIKIQKEDEEETAASTKGGSSKQFARDDKSKYLKLMRPLYSRASKRYTDKIKVSEQISRASRLHSPSVQSLSSARKSAEEKQGNRVAVLEAVRKRLGKSRSTASYVSTSPPLNRRDDSLLEQNDGIQGAILHCKRSYSLAAKDCSVILSRSGSEDLPRASSEELNRWSI